MQKNEFKLAVYFENPFWVGVCERRTGNRLEACRIVFGAEPREPEIYQFLLTHWSDLRFSPPVESCAVEERRISPKRLQREIRRELNSTGAGTRSQQAIKLQQSAGKAAHKKQSHRQREEEAARRFALRQEKKKQKHRGR